jgi:hypothetical protein
MQVKSIAPTAVQTNDCVHVIADLGNAVLPEQDRSSELCFVRGSSTAYPSASSPGFMAARTLLLVSPGVDQRSSSGNDGNKLSDPRRWRHAGRIEFPGTDIGEWAASDQSTVNPSSIRGLPPR